MSPDLQDPVTIFHTRSFTSRSSASVKLLDASSLCILMPQFCDSAFASLISINACSKPVTDRVYLQGVKLHICVAMCQPLDHGGHGIFRSRSLSAFDS